MSNHLAKRLTRLAGFVPLGTFAAMVGSCVLLLPTMPLMSAAKVTEVAGEVALGLDGIPLCHEAFWMARYQRRLYSSNLPFLK